MQRNALAVQKCVYMYEQWIQAILLAGYYYVALRPREG